MNRFYSFALTAVLAAAGASAQTETWQPCGEIEITDDIIASVYPKTVEVSTFTAPLEQSAETPGLYRVVNPYKNWKTPSERYVYDDSQNYYLIIHAEDSKKVWFESFDTGWTDTAEDGDLISATTYVAMYVAHGDELDYIYDVCPDMFGTSDDGLVKFPIEFYLNDGMKPAVLVGVGDTDEGFYKGNKQGKLAFRLPSMWQSVGKGSYTDDLLASAYDVPMQTWEVEIERNIADPTLFRVVNPYAGWDITAEGITLDETVKSYMVIHTAHSPNVWFDDFDTGLRINGEKIVAASDACYFTDKYGYDDTFAETPGIYGQLVDGVMTYAYEYSDGWGSDYPCLYLEVGNSTDEFDVTTIFANKNSGFRLTIPSGETPTDPDWKNIGEGTYTDDLLTALCPGLEAQTYSVVIEQNVTDPGKYRIVNPYEAWLAPDGSDIKYDTAKDYYLTFTIATDDVEDKQYFWIEDFATGLSDAKGTINVTSEVTSMAGMMGIEDTYMWYPEIFGVVSDEGKLLTYPATYQVNGTDYPLLMLYPGEDDMDLTDANTAGKFRITLPGYSGIESVPAVSPDAPVEVYNLQGVKVNGTPAPGIYIRRQGNNAAKVIIR